eukprot:352913-Chlamydomonas_euryale.AAC.5
MGHTCAGCHWGACPTPACAPERDRSKLKRATPDLYPVNVVDDAHGAHRVLSSSATLPGPTRERPTPSSTTLLYRLVGGA